MREAIRGAEEAAGILNLNRPDRPYRYTMGNRDFRDANILVYAYDQGA